MKPDAALGRRKQQLEREREALTARRGGWAVPQTRLDELSAWCAGVAARLPTLD